MASNPIFRALDFRIERESETSERRIWDNAARASSTPERRQAKREPTRKRASLVVRRGRQEERIPCLVLDSSAGGFKLGGAFRLKRGQSVELILHEYSSNVVMCNVMWVGKPGSKQEGEVGLRTLRS